MGNTDIKSELPKPAIFILSEDDKDIRLTEIYKMKGSLLHVKDVLPKHTRRLPVQENNLLHTF